MFDAVADRGRATLRIRLGGYVTVSDLDRRAAALACEAQLETLRQGSTVIVDATTVEGVEPEVQGVLLFLLQRALRIPRCEVLVVTSDRYGGARPPYARRLLQHPRLRVMATITEAEQYARAHEAA